ncbi:WhiB family transcriptional regulator [Streptomyces pathocidini]|uniref:Transcriptional regulator WhiB n=1 Tax=Streptomyces pathocidini TaxID=1650571 RepID=A0ABW7UVC7_9ACTN|nr:WhiB family transcriptional regulator [Streptomyces pathocidini]
MDTLTHAAAARPATARLRRSHRRGNAGPSLSMDRHWRMRAACFKVPTGTFFAPYGSTAEDEALRICRDCPVRTECLAFALDERIPYGIFGGTTPVWRRQLLARRPQVDSWNDLLGRARANHERLYRRSTSARTRVGQAPYLFAPVLGTNRHQPDT